jgi:uncharacterized protein
MGYPDFPYHFDGRGRTADAALEKHVRNLIEQVLFTNPGERVNRPSFGCGLLQTVFAPNSQELAAATQFLVQGSLQEWLGERIQVHEVSIEAVDSELRVTIPYTLREDGIRRLAEFVRAGGVT